MRIAISTGGGDAPGLNAVIRAVTMSALRLGWEVVGIRDGFDGLMFPERYLPDDGVRQLTRREVRGIAHLGGTILGSTNRGSPTAFPVQQDDGTWVNVDRSEELVGMFAAAGIDALVTIGGDGSLAIAGRLAEAGLRVVGVPKTIDNDLEMTDSTFGFNTAVEVATESLDRLFTTATSHGRIIVVEVMGRYAGWIALNSGMAAGAHAILIPEIPFDLSYVAEMIVRREQRRRAFRHRGGRRGSPTARRRAIVPRPYDRPGRAARWNGRLSWRPNWSVSPRKRHGWWCWATWFGEAHRRRSTACSGCGSAVRQYAVSRRASAV